MRCGMAPVQEVNTTLFHFAHMLRWQKIERRKSSQYDEERDGEGGQNSDQAPLSWLVALERLNALVELVQQPIYCDGHA